MANALTKLVYVVFFALPNITLRQLYTSLVAIAPAGRPSPRWTYRQALMVALVRNIVRATSFLKADPPTSLQPGAEGERFALVRLAPANMYIGPLADDHVKPRAIGGTWTPRAPLRARTARPEDLRVALHFHGGAYVIGTGRDADTAFVARVLRENVGCSHVFQPQYRLSDAKGTARFPAALQDALSSYLYLLHELGVPADRIVLSGDSAGGNLALALMRYLADHGAELDIPWPAVALLWSPWTDLTVDKARIEANPNYGSDYLPAAFPLWGIQYFTGHGKIPASSPYVSPGLGPGFPSGCPIWMTTGGKELLFQDNVKLYEILTKAGNVVEWHVDEEAPHDTILVGETLGFAKEARQVGDKAGAFVSKYV